VSLLVHALLLALLSLYKGLQPEALTLTEISWLEPGEEPAASPSPPPPAPRAHEDGIALKRVTQPAHFVRDTERAALEPDPQHAAAVEDRIAERLASLQRESSGQAIPSAVAAAGVPGPVVGLAAVGAGTGVASGTPASLTRSGTGTGRVAPIEMTRSGTGSGVRPVAVATAAPVEPQPAATRKSGEGAAARRTLAGATLLGPVADRRLLAFVQPRYPEWAKKEGVEATVRIYFVVLENGLLKENVVVQKTAGYQDFDNNAIEALRGWRFEPLPRGSAGEQWGEITFHYRLSGGS
jgi:TonB family protein